MRSLLFAALAALSLSACSSLSPAAKTAIGASTIAVAQTSPGQLFCARETAYGPMVVALVDAGAAFAPGGGVAVLAAGATKSFVDAACAQAGGVAVAPPADPNAAPRVAVVPPKA